MAKLPVRFCWECGRKFWGNQHVRKRIDGEIRYLHVKCGDLYPEIPKFVTVKPTRPDPAIVCPCCGFFKSDGVWHAPVDPKVKG